MSQISHALEPSASRRAAEPQIAAAPKNHPIRLLLADDHPIFRDSLRAFLQLHADFEVVGEAADGEETLKLLGCLKPDVLLLDIAMPRKSGMDVLRELAADHHNVRILVLTATIAKAETLRALQYGARGVVLKTHASAMLLDGIRKVMAGEYWIGQEGVSSLVEAVADLDPQRRPARNPYGLTPREHEMVVAVLAGYSNPEIAEKFSLSEQTVKHHLSHIFDKLGVYSRLELALFAVNHRLGGEE